MTVEILARADGKNIHAHLRELMQALGYGVDSGGICYGIAGMAMQAILLSDEAFDEFKARINLLNTYTSESLAKAVENDKHNPDIVNIRAFFDGVFSHMEFKKNHHLLHEFQGERIQDFGLSQKLVLPTGFQDPKSQKDQLIAKLHSFSGFYTSDELQAYLENIEEAVSKYPNFKENICFALGTPQHQILLAYRSIKTEEGNLERKWDLIDANWLNHHNIYSSKHFSESMGYSFGQGDVLFSTDIFVKNSSKEALAVVELIKKNMQQLHTPTSSKVKKEDNNNVSWFELAIRRDQPKVLESLINAGARLDKVDHENQTHIFTAILYNSIDTLKFLIRKKLSIEHKNSDDETPLFYAIKNKKLKAIQVLLESKSNINYENIDRETPVFYSVFHDNMEALDFFIKKGAKLNIKNSEGDTPLILAIKNKNIPAIELLASKKEALNYDNFDGETPLLYALRNNNITAAKVLIEKGATLYFNIRLDQMDPEPSRFYRDENNVTTLELTFKFLAKEIKFEKAIEKFPLDSKEKEMCLSFIKNTNESFFGKNLSLNEKEAITNDFDKILSSIETLVVQKTSDLLNKEEVNGYLRDQGEIILSVLKKQLEDPAADHEKAINTAIALFNVLESLHLKTKSLDKQVMDLKSCAQAFKPSMFQSLSSIFSSKSKPEVAEKPCNVSQFGLFSDQKNFSQGLDDFCHFISQSAKAA